MRSQIAEQTRAAHEALHIHPVLVRLLAPDIAREEYALILGRYLAFYEAAEKVRQSFALLPQLSLSSEIQLLRKDLPITVWSQTGELSMESANQALGLLYVLHGSRFGARVIHRSLEMALPDEPHHFFGSPNASEKWRTLLDVMEAAKHDQAAIADLAIGSQKAFELFGAAMSVGLMPSMANCP